MKFVLLGDDPRVLPLLEELQAEPDCRLVGLVATGELTDELRRRFPGAEAIPGWDGLLVREDLGAVILCGSQPEVLEAGRHLVEAGIPVLLVPSSGQGSEFLYALSLLYDDRPRVLFPVFPDLFSPAVRRLKELLSDQALGPILYCQLQRQAATQPTPGAIDACLLPDVALLRHLAGDYNQVTALYSGVADSRVSLATVTLAGENLPEATWTLQGGAGRVDWRLLVAGSRGQAMLIRQAAAGPLELSLEGGQTTVAKSSPPVPPDGAIQTFLNFCESPPVKTLWQELIRSQETVEATHRSLRRRRTIDLHFETLSERSQFKSHMTALGCGLLCYTFLALLSLLLLGGLFPQPGWVMQTLRVVAFAPLGIFLLLQLLVLIARPESAGVSRGKKDSSAA